jgi:O-antigen/teichoic acid export membrane protein
MILKYKWYAVIVNISMNLVLIPIMGLKGAAVATLCSYIFFIVVGTRESFKDFKIRVPYFAIASYCISSVVMFIMIKGLVAFFPYINLITIILAGVSIYFVSLLICDKDVRSVTILGMQRIVNKLNG